MNKNNRSYLIPIIIALLLIWSAINVSAAFNDNEWYLLHQENFDTDFVGVDGQTFGQDDWLIFQLRNDGAIVSANGYAQLNAPDFWNAALIRSTQILPPEY